MFLNSNVDHHVINNADQEECLVPIRLDMELEGLKSKILGLTLVEKVPKKLST